MNKLDLNIRRYLGNLILQKITKIFENETNYY